MMVSGNIKQRVETDRMEAREEDVPSTSISSSPNDAKFERMKKTTERLMDGMDVNNEPLNLE